MERAIGHVLQFSTDLYLTRYMIILGDIGTPIIKKGEIYTKNQKVWLCGRGDLTSLFFSKVAK